MLRKVKKSDYFEGLEGIVLLNFLDSDLRTNPKYYNCFLLLNPLTSKNRNHLIHDTYFRGNKEIRNTKKIRRKENLISEQKQLSFYTSFLISDITTVWHFLFKAVKKGNLIIQSLICSAIIHFPFARPCFFPKGDRCKGK